MEMTGGCNWIAATVIVSGWRGSVFFCLCQWSTFIGQWVPIQPSSYCLLESAFDVLNGNSSGLSPGGFRWLMSVGGSNSEKLENGGDQGEF